MGKKIRRDNSSQEQKYQNLEMHGFFKICVDAGK
jgi:hypothetical protein